MLKLLPKFKNSMATENKNIWLQEEESRLVKYQHQHRGLSFQKLLLPPSTDKKVNLVGVDNHVYRGSIPRVPEDQLPPEVDEKAIDEEALYKEIRDMNFPPVPENEPLGPSRRIGGSYTLSKRLALAPVKVEHDGLEETTTLGKDGGFYRGTTRCASTIEFEKQLRGTKRAVTKMRQASSSKGFVEPTMVTLQINSKFPSHHRHHKSIMKFPRSNVGKITELIRDQNTEKTMKMKDSINEKKREDIEKDAAESKQTTEIEETIKESKQDDENVEETKQSAEIEESIKEHPQDNEKFVEEEKNTSDVEEDQTKSSMDLEESEQTEQSEEADISADETEEPEQTEQSEEADISADKTDEGETEE